MAGFLVNVSNKVNKKKTINAKKKSLVISFDNFNKFYLYLVLHFMVKSVAR